jgi:hypothetical protein
MRMDVIPYLNLSLLPFTLEAFWMFSPRSRHAGPVEHCEAPPLRGLYLWSQRLCRRILTAQRYANGSMFSGLGLKIS